MKPFGNINGRIIIYLWVSFLWPGGDVAYFIERKNDSKSWVYIERDPVRVPETTQYKLVAAIIKIYATFSGSVFCSLLRFDSFSARSIAIFIVRRELSSSFLLSAPAITSNSIRNRIALSLFTSFDLSLGYQFISISAPAIASLLSRCRA